MKDCQTRLPQLANPPYLECETHQGTPRCLKPFRKPPPPADLMRCIGAALALPVVAAWSPSPATAKIRRPSILAPAPAASGKPKMPGFIGATSRTGSSRRRRSVPSRWRARIPMSFMPAWGRPRSGSTCRMATGFTNPPTPGAPGSIWGLPRPSISAASASIPPTPTSPISQLWAIFSAITTIAGSTAPSMAARPGSLSCTATPRLARSTCRSTPTIRASCSPACGRRGAISGTSPPAGPAAACSARWMAAIPGRKSPVPPAFPPAC